MQQKKKDAYIHVAAVDANQYEINDCWFTNKKSGQANFGCLYNPFKLLEERTYPYVNAYKYENKLPTIYLVEALTYSSAAWSTSEAKNALPMDISWAPTPPLDLGVGNRLQLTDGGGYVNLPIIKALSEFEANPADLLIYGFDFSFPASGKEYDLLSMLKALNERMREINGIEDYFDIVDINPTNQVEIIEGCYYPFTRTKGTFTLTLRLFGLCGMTPKDATPSRTFINAYPTIKALNYLAGNGAAKQWDEKEMVAFVAAYSHFLGWIFNKHIASEAKDAKKIN